MINVEEYLKNNGNTSCYAFVTYDGHIEPTYFQKITDKENGDWFLESPCELYVYLTISDEIKNDINKIREELINYEIGMLIDKNNVEEYVDNFLIPFVKEDKVYEVENFQCLPYLPKEVDDIKITTEKEIFEYLYKLK